MWRGILEEEGKSAAAAMSCRKNHVVVSVCKCLSALALMFVFNIIQMHACF